MESNNTISYPLDYDLLLYENDSSSLRIHSVELLLVKQDDALTECRLSFEVDLESYENIESKCLFNLKSNIRGSFIGKQFLHAVPIQIEITLRPDFLIRLLSQVDDMEVIPKYLLDLSRTQSDHELLHAENWLCLSVKQSQEEGEIGYKTLWYYVNPSLFNRANISNKQVYEKISDFFKESAQKTWEKTTKETTKQLLEEVNQMFESLIDEAFSYNNCQLCKDEKILETVIQFFSSYEWSLVQIPGESVLQMTFQGNNGQWICYAEIRETEEEFIFYSICPINVPEIKRQNMSELLTRLNHGLVLGNFEMDFESGEIHYKTSIAFKGDRLSSALLERLVFTNVLVVDRFLPSIMTLIYSNISPRDIVLQIEDQI